MKPKVMVLQDVELDKWREYHIIDLTFDETMQLIHDLQDGLFGQRNLSTQTGLNYLVVIRP